MMNAMTLAIIINKEMDISLEERQVKNYDERNYYGVK